MEKAAKTELIERINQAIKHLKDVRDHADAAIKKLEEEKRTLTGQARL